MGWVHPSGRQDHEIKAMIPHYKEPGHVHAKHDPEEAFLCLADRFNRAVCEQCGERLSDQSIRDLVASGEP